MIQFKNEQMTVFQSALFQTTSTVIQTDDLVLVVDPTWLPHEVEEIQQHVARIRNRRPLYLLFTHSDWDHVIGYLAFPDATTIGSKEMDDSADKERVLKQIYEFDQKNYLFRSYDIKFPRLDIQIERDGQQLEIGNTKLTFYKALGHNGDGLFTVVEPLGALIAGDYLSNLEFPFIYFSSTEYEKTLGKIDGLLENHPIHFLIPGHGQVTTKLTEIRNRQKRSLDYIAELRQALIEHRQGDIDAMLERSPFPLGMKHFHEDNQKLMRTELGLNRSDHGIDREPLL